MTLRIWLVWTNDLMLKILYNPTGIFYRFRACDFSVIPFSFTNFFSLSINILKKKRSNVMRCMSLPTFPAWISKEMDSWWRFSVNHQHTSLRGRQRPVIVISDTFMPSPGNAIQNYAWVTLHYRTYTIKKQEIRAYPDSNEILMRFAQAGGGR